MCASSIYDQRGRGHGERTSCSAEDLLEIEFKSSEHERLEFSLLSRIAEDFVPAFLEREDFQSLVGRVTDPVFLDPKTGVEVLFLVAVAAHGGRRDNFDQQARGAEDSPALDHAQTGGGHKHEVRFDGV